ncbi:unnamed protein product, partial [Didymodactylos carnosus]
SLLILAFIKYSRKQATKLLSYEKQQTKDLINKNEQTIFERNRQPDIKSDKNLMNNGGGGLLSDPLQRAAHLEKITNDENESNYQ